MANTGRIIKSKASGNFTTISNDVCRSEELTLEEKGLLVYLLSLPCDWVVYRQHLYNRLNEAKNKIDRTFRGLQEKGYIHSVKLHQEGSGKFMGWEHVVTDSPTLSFSDVGKIRCRINPKSEISEVGETAPILKKDIDTKKDYNKEIVDGRFIKPSLEDVKEVFLDKGHPGEADRFFNYYESNGWKVGKNPMKNWKAAVSNWIKNLDRYGNNKQGTGQGIGKNDYKSAAAQYDFEKYGDTPVGQIFGIGRSR